MSTLPNLWAELREASGKPAGGPDAGGFRMLLASAGPALRLFVGLREPADQVALVFEFPATTSVRDLGRELSGRVFEVGAGVFSGFRPGYHGIAITLLDGAYEDLFALLGEELGHIVRESLNPPVALARLVKTVERWRTFLQRANPGLLTVEETRGLIGELIVLARCIGLFGPTAALSGWLGPLRGLRDFELGRLALEVKTYASERQPVLRFGDPGQLEWQGGAPLYVTAVALRSGVEPEGLTINDYVGAVRVKLPADLDSVFLERLARVGYLEPLGPRYTDRFVAQRLQLFQVREGFPGFRVPTCLQGSWTCDLV